MAAAPFDLEAEQAFLGALLFDNTLYERIPQDLRPTDFFEPIHGRIFGWVVQNVRDGQLADPVRLSDHFSKDKAFIEIGGLRYIADLIDRAPPTDTAVKCGVLIGDLAMRRDLVQFGLDIANSAASDREVTARMLVDTAEQQLYLLGERQTHSASGFVSFASALTSAVQVAADAFMRDGPVIGTKSGIREIDERLLGIRPSDVIVMAEKAASDTVNLVLRSAFSVARDYRWEPSPEGRKTVSGGIVALFSVNSTADQIATDLLSHVSGVSATKVREGKIDSNEFGIIRSAAIEIGEAPLFIDASPNLTLSKVFRRARQIKRSHGLDLIAIDEIVDLHGDDDGSTIDGLSALMERLVRLARELDIIIEVGSRYVSHLIAWSDSAPQLVNGKYCDSFSIEDDKFAFAITSSPRGHSKENSPWNPIGVTVDQIQKETARQFGVSDAAIRSDSRTRDITLPRQVAMYLSKQLTNRSYPDLGRRFGGRDHTAILHSVRKIEKAVLEDRELAEKVGRIRNRLVHGSSGDEN